ncbi:MAG: restriction endonuclease subunit S [Leptospiraceae bacterium]|nr:restriction endonuclease subunit S [Leptospiraceae bacterium]MCP5494178.1 restriction endonuclease subunit S [Leptospiraceae bacterium]
MSDVLPNGWVWCKAEDIASIMHGGTPDTSIPEYFSENDGIPWITPSDLTNYEKQYISRGRRFLTESGLKNSSAKILPKDSILLSLRVPIGYCVISSNELCTNQGFKNFILFNDVEPKYIRFYLINSKD